MASAAKAELSTLYIKKIDSAWCFPKEVLERHKIKMVGIPGPDNPSQLSACILDAASHPSEVHPP